MDSRRLEDLVPAVADKARQVKAHCTAAGFELLIYCTLRSLEDQAVLFRKSQPHDRVELKIAQFRERGFDFLADVLIAVGPQPTGARVTNAGPGESWHNFGEAFDAVPQIAGRELWEYESAAAQWEAYGGFVRDAGLTWGGDWSKFPDRPHAQLRPDGNPLRVFSPDQARAILRDRGLL